MKKLTFVSAMLALIGSSSAFSATLVSLHMNTAPMYTDSKFVIGLFSALIGIMAIRVYRNKLHNR